MIRRTNRAEKRADQQNSIQGHRWYYSTIPRKEEAPSRPLPHTSLYVVRPSRCCALYDFAKAVLEQLDWIVDAEW